MQDKRIRPSLSHHETKIVVALCKHGLVDMIRSLPIVDLPQTTTAEVASLVEKLRAYVVVEKSILEQAQELAQTPKFPTSETTRASVGFTKNGTDDDEGFTFNEDGTLKI